MVLDSDPWFAGVLIPACRGDIGGGRHFEVAGRSRGRAGVLSACWTQRVQFGVVDAEAPTTVSDRGNSQPERISPVARHGSGALR